MPKRPPKMVFSKPRGLESIRFLARLEQYANPEFYEAATGKIRINPDLENYPEIMLALRPAFTEYKRVFSASQGEMYAFGTTLAKTVKHATELLSPLNALARCSYECVAGANREKVAEVFFFANGIGYANPQQCFFDHKLDFELDELTPITLEEEIRRCADQFPEPVVTQALLDATTPRGLKDTDALIKLALRAFDQRDEFRCISYQLSFNGYGHSFQAAVGSQDARVPAEAIAVARAAVDIFKPAGAHVYGWSFYVKELKFSPHVTVASVSDGALSPREAIRCKGEIDAILREHGTSLEAVLNERRAA